jgi:hypothetical protein
VDSLPDFDPVWNSSTTHTTLVPIMADEPSYIDYETFLDPSFSSVTFANQLVLNTNHPTDNPVDLSTPLSKVLFDVQEIDTHIDSMTTKSAIPLLEYTTTRAEASQRILDEVESQVTSLTEAYKILQKEVIERYEAAEQVRLVAERLNQTVRLARGVSRCVLLGRQLQVQMTEYNGPATTSHTISNASSKKQDFRAMVRAAHTLATLKTLLASNTSPRDEGYGLASVSAVTALRTDLMQPTETLLINRASQTVREFSMSALVTAASNTSTTSSPSRNATPTSRPSSPSAPTYIQNEETKTRATSALLVLYLLSPPPGKSSHWAGWAPKLAISALQEYMQTSLRASLASLTRSLATLPTLDRTLLELSARCQNVVALEALLEGLIVPVHPASLSRTAKSEENGDDKAVIDEEEHQMDQQGALLPPLLATLDTPSLPSFFWRALASALSKPVSEIISKGGVSARQLRANKDRVREAVKACVDRGSRVPDAVFDTSIAQRRGMAQRKGWEREAAVMVAAVVGRV